MNVLVTGAAGFIGAQIGLRLCERGDRVQGIDNLNDYYDVALKHARLARLQDKEGFDFIQMDIADTGAMQRLFEKNQYDAVVNMAAQPGVRYSLTHPHAYMQSNLVGFLNVLEGCRQQQVKHFVYASSSSVYGANTRLPYAVGDNVDHPVSLYAATKKSNELMAHTYSHLYGIATTGLRFFTVYGPWGRPDMAYFSFTKAILEGRSIQIFNQGQMSRDFTYIDDIVEAVVRVIDHIPTPDPDWQADQPSPGSSYAPYRIYNIGNHEPETLMHFVQILEEALGREAIKEMLPMQAGDVVNTYADASDLAQAVGFAPSTPLKQGLEAFVAWYRAFYKV